MRQHYTIIL